MWRFTLFTVALASTYTGAFAQGKISMLNDSARAVYFGTPVKPADAAYIGQAVPAGGSLPSGVILLVDLYGGTNADNMTLQWTTTISGGAAGLFGPVGFISPNLPGGQTATMRVKVRESTFPTAEASQAGGGYWGYSQIFTFKPGSTIAYNSIINQGGTTLSTWSNGTYNLGWGFGAVEVTIGLGELGRPVFYAQPSSGSYFLGTNVTLSAAAVGDSPLSYQWRKDGTAVGGATNTSLTLTNIALIDAGNYDLVATNSWGAATGTNAVLQVLPPNAPSISVNNILAVGA